MLFDQIDNVVGNERLFACEYLIDHQPKGINIAAGRDFLSDDLFRSHVGRRPGTDTIFGDLALDPGDTEISDACNTLFVDDDVGGLKVAMKNAGLMDRLHADAKLPRYLDRSFGRKPPDPSQQVRQVVAIDKLHRQKMPPVDLADVENAADVNMRDLPGMTHLSVKPLERLGVFFVAVGQELECNGLRELDVLGLIDLAHPAFAYQTNDPIPAREYGSGYKVTLQRPAGRIAFDLGLVFVAR